MKLLILSCATGGGHNSAGYAVGKFFERQGHTWEMVNALDFMPKQKKNFISRGHDFAYRCLPKAYGACYRIEERHPSRIIYDSNSKYAPRLLDYINRSKCDAILCVHLFPAIMATELRRLGLLDVPFYFLATDYTCSPGVGEIEPDKFCIPHALLSAEFVRNGIPAEKLVATGIPVDDNICHHGDKLASRQMMGLPEIGQMILITCGSMGCGPVEDITKRLLQTMPRQCFVVVVCGKNRQLFRRVQHIRDSRLTVLKYTEEMNTLMDAADIALIKAGGLSTAEMAAKGLPIIYMNAVPGCESRNIEFMVNNGYALTANDSHALAELTCDCLSSPENALVTVKNRGSFFTESSAARVYACITGRQIAIAPQPSAPDCPPHS